MRLRGLALDRERAEHGGVIRLKVKVQQEMHMLADRWH